MLRLRQRRLRLRIRCLGLVRLCQFLLGRNRLLLGFFRVRLRLNGRLLSLGFWRLRFGHRLLRDRVSVLLHGRLRLGSVRLCDCWPGEFLLAGDSPGTAFTEAVSDYELARLAPGWLQAWLRRENARGG